MVIKSEFRKIVRDRGFLVLLGILLLFIVIESYTAYNLSYKQTLTDAGREAYELLYQEIKGDMTTEKLLFLIEEDEKLGAEVLSKTYSTQYDETTYTGYVYGDYSMIHFHLYLPVKQLYEYRLWANEVVLSAQENILFFEELNNPYQVRINSLISEAFMNRNIAVFYDTTGAELLLNTGDVTILLVLLICFMGISTWIKEKETGMISLIQTTEDGRKKVVRAKLGAYYLTFLGVAATVSILRLVIISFLFDWNGLLMPIYSLESYGESLLNCSVILFYFVQSCIVFLGMSTIILIVSMISIKAKQSMEAFIKVSIFMVVLYVLNEWNIPVLQYLNPFSLLNNGEWFQRYEYTNMFSYPVNILTLVVAIQVWLIVTLHVIIMKIRRFTYDQNGMV